LTYPYLNSKEEVASDTVANQNDKEISQGSKIVEIVDCNKPINELERME